MLIRTAMDRRTGAIVANATVQTPYRQDWVRDGAFFNYALLLAGYDEMAKGHAEFYARIHRPGGTWDSFYYPDGAEAGAVFPYEIDSQGFALWALWLPYEFTGDRDYLERVYPAIAATADALLLCADPLNGMQCYAAEDDALQPTQGAQGAATTYLALRSASAAAEAVGADANPRWASRASELAAAAVHRLCNPGGCRGGRGGVYLAWPSRLLSDAAPALLQPHLAQFVAELDSNASFTTPVIGGYVQYPMEPLLALAPLWADPDRATRLAGWTRWLTDDVAHPGLLQFGERIFRIADRAYLHSIGFPHIWSGAETYIAAAFVHGLIGCPEGQLIGEAICRG
jgi:GH15 family glucan-1,4-alpha-glucosidase